MNGKYFILFGLIAFVIGELWLLNLIGDSLKAAFALILFGGGISSASMGAFRYLQSKRKKTNGNENQ